MTRRLEDEEEERRGVGMVEGEGERRLLELEELRAARHDGVAREASRPLS